MYDDDIHDLFPPEPPDEPDPWPDEPPYPVYDDRDRAPQPWWAPAEPWRASGRLRNRVTHLVLVDGRLVDSWSEPAERSDYLHVAEWLDEQSRPQVVPPPAPPRAPYETALEWLDSLVGGREALESLADHDIAAPATLGPDDLPLASRHRLEAVGRSLDAVAEEFWDEEVRLALHVVLSLVWTEVPDVVLRAKSAAHVAAGICWVVGRANDLFGAERVTQKAVAQQLGLGTTLSACGTTFHHALRGLQPPFGSRPWNQPDLLATGRPELLLGVTRRRLLRLRDQTLAVRDQHRADEARKVLPSGVESTSCRP
jgi:hypothetical protein